MAAPRSCGTCADGEGVRAVTLAGGFKVWLCVACFAERERTGMAGRRFIRPANAPRGWVSHLGRDESED